MKKYFKIVILSLLLVFPFACADLDVQNENEPDLERVLANPEDYIGVVEGSFISFWQMQTRAEPNMVLGTVADQISCSWGNFGMNVYSSEPRVGYDNSPTSAFSPVAERGWSLGYGGLGSINDVMRLLNSGKTVVIDDVDVTAMVKATGAFLQGTMLGHIGLLYDRAYIVDETIDPSSLPSLPFPAESNYKEVIAKAIEKLETCIEVCENNTFVMDASLLRGVALDQDELAELAHTYIARLLVYSARTAAENAETDWDKVEEHASSGLSYNFSVPGDNNFYYDEYKVYGSLSGWGRVDQRIVHLFDPTQPARYPTDGTTNLGEVTTDDARIDTDFAFVATQNFNPGRGLYHYSNYRVKRYDDTHGFAGNMVLILKAENDLLLAEAIIRNGGSLSEAAELINNSRVTRGGLTPLTGSESTADLLEAIFYERNIELILTCAIVPYADQRRVDGLQSGSWKQLPVPGSELELLGEPIYSFP